MGNSYPAASNGFHVLQEPGVDIGRGVSGTLIEYTALSALKLGEAVYTQAAGVVEKSSTVGNHIYVAGIVVGGWNTDMQAIADSALVNVLTAADAGERVLVLVHGIYWIISGGAITAGGQIVMDTGTAGRAKAATTLAVAATGLTIAAGATPVTSTAANGAIISGTGTVSGDGIGRTFGRMIEAAGGAAEVKLAYINV